MEVLERIIERCKTCKLNECINCEISWNEVQEIENTINRLQDLEQIEAEHKKINGDLIEQIKKLEEDKKHYEIMILKDYVSKFVIKENIEKLETKRSKFKNDNVNKIFIREFIRKYTEKNDHDYGMFNTQEVITYMMNNEYNAEISILRKLLEENK